jgi:hypothetical protein
MSIHLFSGSLFYSDISELSGFFNVCAVGNMIGEPDFRSPGVLKSHSNIKSSGRDFEGLRSVPFQPQKPKVLAL